MGLAGLYGAAGAYEGLKDLLARRMLERQQGEHERSTLADEDFRERQLGEQTSLRQLTQTGLEQERLRDEQYRRDALAQSGALAGNTQALSLARLRQAESAAGATDRRHRETLNLRRDLANQANQRIVNLATARRAPTITPEYFKWIQSLPQTDKDMQAGVQKALKFAPTGDNQQEIVQAVREAYGMTARPTATEIGRIPQDVRLRLQTELDNWEIEGKDLDDANFAAGRQRIIEKIFGDAGLHR